MKWVGFIVAVVLAILFLFAILLPSPSRRNAPRYIPGRTSPVGNYKWTDYDWISLRPFVNDQFWLFGTHDGTNHFTCLYDLRERMILGELINAGVVLANADNTKLLVQGQDSPAANLKSKLLALLQRIAGGLIKTGNDQLESLWVLDLRDNSSRRVGTVSQYSGTGSRWYTSPGLRYGCTSPTTENQQAFVLFDFETDAFTRVPVSGWVRGWWDETHIFLQADNHDFLLCNATNHQTTVLFSAAAMQKTLEQLHLPTDPANVVAFANWNGREYDFYFAEKDYEFRAKQCFLLKAERTSPEPGLKLIAREFKFEWGGHLDPQAKHFLYQGESGAVGSGGHGAVYLRDLADNSVRTLVPPDDKGQYSIPRFYGNEVIYVRNRVLWRIGLDGSNNAPLFPTSNQTGKP